MACAVGSMANIVLPSLPEALKFESELSETKLDVTCRDFRLSPLLRLIMETNCESYAIISCYCALWVSYCWRMRSENSMNHYGGSFLASTGGWAEAVIYSLCTDSGDGKSSLRTDEEASLGDASRHSSLSSLLLSRSAQPKSHEWFQESNHNLRLPA